MQYRIIPQTDGRTAPPFDNITYEHREENAFTPGATATVFLGTASRPGGAHPEEVVVKVPFDQFEDFIADEHKLITDINIETSQLHPQGWFFTPEVAHGVREGDQRPVLVMPLYRERLLERVRGWLESGDFRTAESLAVSSLRDFTYVMAAIHGLNQSVPDRKIDDFFLVEAGRLVVIDWNVLGGISKEDLAAEMSKLGSLWHELMLGLRGVPPFAPFDDTRWVGLYNVPNTLGGTVSLGLRCILAEMVDERGGQFQQNGLPDTFGLREALESWLRWLNLPAAEIKTLSAQAERIANSGEVSYILGAGFPLPASAAAAILLDLACRLEMAIKGSALWQAREDAFTQRRREMGEASALILALLREGETEKAQAQHQETRLWLERGGMARDVAVVNWAALGRWDLYFEMDAARAFGLRSPLRDYRGQVQEAFHALATDPAQDTDAALMEMDTRLAALPGGYPALDTLKAEVALRLALLDIRAADVEDEDYSALLAKVEAGHAAVPYFSQTYAEKSLLDSLFDVAGARRRFDARNRDSREEAYRRLRRYLEDGDYPAFFDAYARAGDGQARLRPLYLTAKYLQYAEVEEHQRKYKQDIIERGEAVLHGLDKSDRLILKPHIHAVQMASLGLAVEMLRWAVKARTYEALREAESDDNLLRGLDRYPALENALQEQYPDLPRLLDAYAAQQAAFNQLLNVLLESAQPSPRRDPASQNLQALLLELSQQLGHAGQVLETLRQVDAVVDTLPLRALLAEKLIAPTDSQLALDSQLYKALYDQLEEKAMREVDDFLTRLKHSISQAEQAYRRDLDEKINSLQAPLNTYRDIQNQISSAVQRGQSLEERIKAEIAPLKSELEGLSAALERIKTEQERYRYFDKGYAVALNDVFVSFVHEDTLKVGDYLEKSLPQARKANLPVLDALHTWQERLEAHHHAVNTLNMIQKEMKRVEGLSRREAAPRLTDLLNHTESLMDDLPPLIFASLYQTWHDTFKQVWKALESVSPPQPHIVTALNESEQEAQRIVENIRKLAKETSNG